jgi:hypothetical protein
MSLVANASPLSLNQLDAADSETSTKYLVTRKGWKVASYRNSPVEVSLPSLRAALGNYPFASSAGIFTPLFCSDFVTKADFL